MINKKMFVVYITKDDKKERLYYKARNVYELIKHIWCNTTHDTIQIKRLKRIYKKSDNFTEV